MLDDLTSRLDLLSASAAMGTVSPGTKAVRGSVSVADMGPLYNSTEFVIVSDKILCGGGLGDMQI